MNLFERILVRAERWVDSIDRERDQLAATLDGTVVRTDVHVAFVHARLALLEEERVEALQLLADLRARQFHPALLFPSRPMLRMPARPVRKRA